MFHIFAGCRKSQSRRSCRILLFICWILGLICGFFFCCSTDILTSLMRRTVSAPVSIVGHGAVIFLPYLFSAYAVMVSRPGLVAPLAFCKAFTFSCCACSMDLAFSSAGWLIRLFLMFSDLCSFPVLLYLWQRCLSADKKGLTSAFSAALVLLLAIWSIDYLIISPFLASMI